MSQGPSNAFANIPNANPATPRLTLRSNAALISMIFALLAVPLHFLFCCAPISIPVALVAVVVGHVAMSQINRSEGTLTGKGLARTGLIVGYVSLLLSAVSITWMIGQIRNAEPGVDNRPPEKIALAAAESAINTDSRGRAHGNSARAKELAEAFASVMEEIDKEAFTDTKAKIKLSGGHYVTWCELQKGRCAFVVHVPEYRKFADDAKKVLHEAAWTAAQKIARKELKPGDQLAVGLRGVLLYGAVIVGSITDNEPNAGKLEQGTDSDKLLPFFKSPEAEQLKAPAQAPPVAAAKKEGPATVEQPKPVSPPAEPAPVARPKPSPSAPAAVTPTKTEAPAEAKPSSEKQISKSKPTTPMPTSADPMEQALEDLRSDDKAKRRAAAEKLASISPSGPRDETTKALLDALTKKDHFTQMAAAKALAVWGDAAIVPQLVSSMKAESDTFVRHEIITTLGKLGGREAIEALVGGIDKQSDRRDIASALKGLGADAETAVIARLKDSDKDMRKAACDVLAEIGTKRCLSALKIAAKDSENSVRFRAEAAIKKVEGRN